MNFNTLIKRISLSLLLIVLFQSAYCQENYQSGYIVRSAGDTLHGFIDYRAWARNPDKISFKEKLSADKAVYTPLTITSFEVNKTNYQSAIVETEVSPEIENGIDAYSDLKFKTDTAFLQTMIKGTKSLYSYINKSSKAQFYIKNGTTYELLIHKMYTEEKAGRMVQSENKKYIGQLIYYFQDCLAIQSKVSNMEYKIKDLENLFTVYYKNTKSEIYFQKEREKISTEFGLLADVSITSLKFRKGASSYDYIYLTDANYTKSTSFSGGLFFNLVLPKAKRRWSVNNELIYNSYKINGQFDGYDYENTTVYLTLGYSYLKINNLLRYTFPIGKLAFFLKAGVSTGYKLGETNYRKTVQVINNNSIITERPALFYTRKIESSYVLGLGAKYKKCSFELRFEKGNGVLTNAFASTTTTRLYFGLGYDF